MRGQWVELMGECEWIWVDNSGYKVVCPNVNHIYFMHMDIVIVMAMCSTKALSVAIGQKTTKHQNISFLTPKENVCVATSVTVVYRSVW